MVRHRTALHFRTRVKLDEDWLNNLVDVRTVINKRGRELSDGSIEWRRLSKKHLLVKEFLKNRNVGLWDGVSVIDASAWARGLRIV